MPTNKDLQTMCDELGAQIKDERYLRAKEITRTKHLASKQIKALTKKVGVLTETGMDMLLVLQRSDAAIEEARNILTQVLDAKTDWSSDTDTALRDRINRYLITMPENEDLP